jgi:hypothetical protein
LLGENFPTVAERFQFGFNRGKYAHAADLG